MNLLPNHKSKWRRRPVYSAMWTLLPHSNSFFYLWSLFPVFDMVCEILQKFPTSTGITWQLWMLVTLFCTPSSKCTLSHVCFHMKLRPRAFMIGALLHFVMDRNHYSEQGGGFHSWFLSSMTFRFGPEVVLGANACIYDPVLSCVDDSRPLFFKCKHLNHIV